MNRTQWTHPDLQSLVQLFYENIAELGEFAEVPPETLPNPFREMLAHTSHMTVTMEQHHDSAVDVNVLDRQSTSNHYSRKILLRRQSDQQVVQFGIVRLASAYLDEAIREKIEREDVPLGRILIDNNVMRTVKLMSTWKIKPGPALLDCSGTQPSAEEAVKECFGRTALIYTDGIPAVELLEIALNV